MLALRSMIARVYISIPHLSSRTLAEFFYRRAIANNSQIRPKTPADARIALGKIPNSNGKFAALSANPATASAYPCHIGQAFRPLSRENQAFPTCPSACHLTQHFLVHFSDAGLGNLINDHVLVRQPELGEMFQQSTLFSACGSHSPSSGVKTASGRSPQRSSGTAITAASKIRPDAI